MRRLNHPIFLVLVSVALTPAVTVPAAEPPYTFPNARQFLQHYCVDCHNAEESQAELNLQRLTDADQFLRERKVCEQVLLRVRKGEMPPKKKNRTPPPEAERQAFVTWLETAMRQVACGDEPGPGPAPIRRLNKSQYRATVRDLLGIHIDAAAELPDDGGGGVGFDNAAETLFLSPVHAEKYLEAARRALGYAAREAAARQRVFVALPNDKTTAEEAARRNLERFATRAYRRPATADEVERLMALFRREQERGQPFDESVLYALRAVLISPHFLFRVERPASGDKPEPLGDYELATRLSFFLWNSMPDDELFQAAAAGKLQDEAELKRQMVRMLKDRKTIDFARSFAEQWLETRRLGGDHKPDRNVFRRYNAELENAMREEPVLFLQEILAENRSLLDLLDADYTYADGALARHYGVPPPDGFGQLKRIKLPAGSHRGGVLTMAGVLAVSSNPNRTSPVLRGKWVMETILGTPAPPPPPDVPELPEKGAQAEGKTLRERLLIHRQNPTCASCHERIDPIGFGLENYDALGRWRTTDAGRPIDATGTLPDGTSFDGPEGLKKVLLAQKDQFVRHLAVKMLGYALGRGLVPADYCVVEQAGKELQKGEYRAQVLLWEIIRSTRFRYRSELPKVDKQ